MLQDNLIKTASELEGIAAMPGGTRYITHLVQGGNPMVPGWLAASILQKVATTPKLPTISPSAIKQQPTVLEQVAQQAQANDVGNQPQQQEQPMQPQGYSGGGIVRLAEGGSTGYRMAGSDPEESALWQLLKRAFGYSTRPSGPRFNPNAEGASPNARRPSAEEAAAFFGEPAPSALAALAGDQPSPGGGPANLNVPPQPAMGGSSTTSVRMPAGSGVGPAPTLPQTTPTPGMGAEEKGAYAGITGALGQLDALVKDDPRDAALRRQMQGMPNRTADALGEELARMRAERGEDDRLKGINALIAAGRGFGRGLTPGLGFVSANDELHRNENELKAASAARDTAIRQVAMQKAQAEDARARGDLQMEREALAGEKQRGLEVAKLNATVNAKLAEIYGDQRLKKAGLDQNQLMDLAKIETNQWLGRLDADTKLRIAMLDAQTRSAVLAKPGETMQLIMKLQSENPKMSAVEALESIYGLKGNTMRSENALRTEAMKNLRESVRFTNEKDPNKRRQMIESEMRNLGWQGGGAAPVEVPAGVKVTREK